MLRGDFKGWVQKVLPAVYDESLSYQDLLYKVIYYLENTLSEVDKLNENYLKVKKFAEDIKKYCDEYFQNLDVQEEINNKLDEMVLDGTLQNLLMYFYNIEKTFHNISQMVNDTTLVIGQKVKVYSQNNINDGGGAYYVIGENGDVPLNNGLYASYINNFENNYYDEITCVKERYFDTDCYITTIPKYDKHGNLIKLYVGDGRNENLTPLQYAQKENTTLTINGSLYLKNSTYGNGVPSIISNGEIINENDMLGGLPSNILYLGIKADRTFTEYPVNETTAQQMIEDGCEQVIDVFWKLVDNGVAVDLTNIVRDDGVNADEVQGPRQTIGVKLNGDIVILTCDGRTEANIGLYSHEQQQIMMLKGCVNAWNLDGGGSTSTILKGSKINRNIDDNGTTDRYIPYTLNVKKPTVNKEISEIYNEIGKQKQNIINQIINDLQDRKIGTQIILDPYTLSEDSFHAVQLGNMYGSTYSKENIILEKEEESEVYTKFKINKKGYFKVSVICALLSRTGNKAKYIKIKRVSNNYDMPGSNIGYSSTLDVQRIGMISQAYIRVRNVNEEFSIMLDGDINDAVVQGCVMIEEI